MSYPDPFAGKYPNQQQQQQPEDNSRSAAAVVKGRRQHGSSYIPYQDSPYYNDGSYHSSGSADDAWDRYYNGRDPYNHRYTKETIRHRKYNGTDSTTSGLDREGKPDLAASRRTEYDAGGREEEHSPMIHGDRDRERHRGRSAPRKTELERRGRSRRRSRSFSSSRSRSRSRSRSTTRSRGPRKYQPPPNIPPQKDPYKPRESYTLLKAAKSAAMAGGVEAVRCRLEPGGWKGQKAQRVAIAAAVGVAIGSLRNGQLLSSGKKPYAEAAMTGFYAIDFLKRVARHTEFDATSKKEQRDWRERAEEEGQGEGGDEGRGRSRSRSRRR